MKRKMIQVAALAALAAFGCKGGPGYNLPPMERLMAPGPGVGGPGPGVLTAADLPGPDSIPGLSEPPAKANGHRLRCRCRACLGHLSDPSMLGEMDDSCEYAGAPAPTVQVLFAKPEGMEVTWGITGSGDFDSEPLIVPGRTNFSQAGLYRVKLQNIPGHEGMELYPTLEVGPANPRTLAYLAHNAIPLQLTVDDFNQVMAGNFVTKVIYLPDPEFQELAVAGVETLVSTRLDPGVNPIVEADRRGAILAVLRIGNKDIEMPGMENEVDSFAGSLNPAAAGGSSGFAAGPGGPIYGMPQTGTPIGLPGPAHIPLGGPAGLKRHSMYNHTHTYLPEPTRKIGIHVKQQPGTHYPVPRNKAFIHEYNVPNCSHCNGAGCQACLGGH